MRAVILVVALSGCGQPAARPAANAAPTVRATASAPAVPSCRATPQHPPLTVRRAPRVALREPVRQDLQLLRVEEPSIHAAIEAFVAPLRTRPQTEAARCAEEARLVVRCDQPEGALPPECATLVPSCTYSARCRLEENDGEVFAASCTRFDGSPFEAEERRWAFLRAPDGAYRLAVEPPLAACEPSAPSWGPRPTREPCAIPVGAPVAVTTTPLRRTNGRSTLEGTTLSIPAIPELSTLLRQAVDELWRYAVTYHSPPVDCRLAGSDCNFAYSCNVTRNDGALLSVRCHYQDVIINAKYGSTSYNYVRAGAGWRALGARELLLQPEALESRVPELAEGDGFDWDSPRSFGLADEGLVLLGLRSKPSEPDPTLPWGSLRDDLACPYHTLLTSP